MYLDDEPVAEGDEREFSFTPGDAGTYTIDLRLGDKDFGESFATTELIVDEAGPVAAAPVVTAGEDATVDEGGTYASGGSFADSDPGDAWTATVDYGDGTGEQPLTPHADRSLDLTHV